jgi:matrixin
VDFGNLGATDLGYACWWTWGRSTTESDMRLNSTEYSWAVNLGGCVGKYSVEDVATHELGHTFGLNDLSENLHPALTMSLVMLPCQNAETTLGLGDVRGLKALY